MLGVVIACCAAAVIASSSKVRRTRLPGEQVALALLVVVQSAYLLFAGVGLNSYSHNSFPSTPALAKLQGKHRRQSARRLRRWQHGVCGRRSTDLRAARLEWSWAVSRDESGYQVHELAMHDPVIPAAYFAGWPVPNAGQQFAGNLNLFVSAISTVALARQYGVRYVLAPANTPPPVAMKLVSTLVPASSSTGGAKLYEVPGASQFSFASGSMAKVTATTHPNNAAYDLNVMVPQATRLSVRITNVAGWQVRGDGKTLAVQKTSTDLLSVVVPKGTQKVVVTYWLRYLTLGLVLLLAVLSLIGVAIARRRFSHQDAISPPQSR